MTALYRFLSSKALALSLFGALVAILVPKTIIKEKIFLLDAAIDLLLAAIALNLLLCTIRRFKAISGPVLIIHLGIIITLAGTLISSRGYVATVNVYEGSATDTFYRWDLERDVSLGFTMEVAAIHRSFYPVGVKVGVLRGEEKAGLFVLNTGESFDIDGLQVTAREFNWPAGSLGLEVHDRQGRLLGTCDTAGGSDLPADFPYSFKLVAYQNPTLKRIWTDIRLLQDNRVVVAGTSEVNQPLIWNGLRFYTTQVEADRAGQPYAGIQIVRDPGIPCVYAGFGIICLGALAALGQLFGKGRKARTGKL